MSEAEKPPPKRLFLANEARLCFARHFARCYQQQDKNIPILKMNLIKFAFTSRSAAYATRTIMRNFWLISRIGHMFEVVLEKGTGPSFSLEDTVTFCLMDIIMPTSFRISGTFGDFGNYRRIGKLIKLSKYSKELVAFKPTHVGNFIQLLENMGQKLDYLECDPMFLTHSDLPPLRINYYKSSPTNRQILLRDILHHRITCLDLQNDAAGADECPTQYALEKLIVSRSIKRVSESVNYFEGVKAFTPNLQSYEVWFKEELSKCDMMSMAEKLGEKLLAKFDAVVDMISQCRGQMRSLTIFTNIQAVMHHDTPYDKDWMKTMQTRTKDYHFDSWTETNGSSGQKENVVITKSDEFYHLEFKVRLLILPHFQVLDNFVFIFGNA